MGKSTKPDQQAARRMQSAADRNPDSKTARTGGARRVQSTADKNAPKGKSGRN